MAKPRIAYDLLNTLVSGSASLPKEGFHFNGNNYIGLRTTAWQEDERAWGHGDPYPGETNTDPLRSKGSWHGPRPLRVYAGLELDGATYEKLGHDDLARVASSGARRVSWNLLFPGDDTLQNNGPITWRILHQSADGSILSNTTTQNLYADLSIPAGSSVVWARSESATPQWALPPDYYSVRGFTTVPQKFRYIENNIEYIWDFETDVGRRPLSSTQLALDETDMWDEYQKLFFTGQLQTRGAWTQFIVSPTPQGSEWSALRVQCGGGDFAMNAGVIPAPGAALVRITAQNTLVPIGFDPLARSVTVWDLDEWDLNQTHCVLEGTIATRRGPVLGHWQFNNDETAVLLGTNEDVTGNICEAALNPEASDSILARDTAGSIKRLICTFANLHEYSQTKDDGTPEPDITKRLPGVPRVTGGHPGGRCLRAVPGISGDLIRLLTENFEIKDGFFYNRLEEFLLAPNAARFRGMGTVFHGFNCAETVWNGYYGWRQNKAFSSDGQTTDPDAKQFLAKLENQKWIDVGMEAFPANMYRWQRLRQVVTSDGTRLVVCGKSAPPAPDNEPDSAPSELLTDETAIWAICDGRQFREGSLNFRARRLTRVLTPQGERIYAVGRFVQNNLVSTQWSVISLSGEFQKVCFFWDDANTRYAVSRNTLENAGVDVTKLASYLVWVKDVDQNAGGFWGQRTQAPAPGTPYLQLSVTQFIVSYTRPSGVTLPYDPAVWGRFCPTVYDDGSLGNEAIIVLPGAQNAGDALAQMPAGSWAMIVSEEIGASELGYEPPDGFQRATWNAIQVSDVGDWDTTITGMRKLAAIGLQYPNLWVRFDSTAAPMNLSTYTHRIAWDRFQNLRGSASQKVEACVLVTPAAGRVFPPVLEPCA